MGVIQKQGFQDFIVSFIGVIIGLLSMLFIYPLNHELYGFYNTIYGGSQLLLPLISLGAARTVIKYFRKSKSKNDIDKGVLGFCIGLNFLGFLLTSTLLLIIYIFNVKSIGALDISIIYDHIIEILVIAFALGLTSTLTGQISNYAKITIPTILVDISYKLFLPAIILYGYYNNLEGNNFTVSYTLFFILVLISMLFYGWKIGAVKLVWDYSVYSFSKIKELLNYSMYSALGVLGGVIAFKIDAIMISGLLDFSATGLYFNILVMTNTIAMTNNAIAKISGPIISSALSDNDLHQVSEIYKKASINSLIVGLLIFFGLWFNLDNLIAISSNPEAFSGALNIFLILGLAKLFDVSTSVNNPIIQYSNFYRYNLLFILLLGVFNIIFNFIFIRSYGLVGAAMATGLSFMLYNFLKLLFIKWKFNLIPFTKQTMKLLGIAVLFICLRLLLPSFEAGWNNIIITSVILTISFISLVYYSNISLDFNSMLKKYYSYARIRANL